MRVLFVCNWVRVGGLETNLVLLTRELTRRGHEILIASPGGELQQSLEDAGGGHFELPIGRGAQREVLRTARRLARLIRDERVDLVHVFSATTAVLLKLASFFARARGHRWPPVVSSVMGLDDSPNDVAAKAYIKCFATTIGADRTLIISPAIGKIISRLPVRASRVRECPVVGVDVQRLADSATLARVAAVLHPRKSHELFIQAAAIVVARAPQARFFIAGTGSPQTDLEAEIERLELRGKVTLLGQRADIAELIGATEVYVKPGVVEGFVGITVLEAQSIGTPVVAFDTVDVRLAITDGATGLIVPKNDVSALAGAITRLFDDHALASQMSAAGKTMVRDKFSIGAVVDRLATEYAELTTR